MRRVPGLLMFVLALLVLIAAVLAILPSVVRWQLAARATVLTGRPVRVAAVSVNLFARRFAVSDLSVLDRDGREPVIGLRRFEARFHLLPLLRGRISIHEAALEEPMVRLVRRPSGDWNVDDILRRLRSRPPSKPVWFALDRLSVTRGGVSVRDEHVGAAAEWRVENATFDVRDVGTDRASGNVTGKATLAGATLAVAVRDLRVAPPRAHPIVRIADLDLTRFREYLPESAVTLARARLSTRIALVWDESAGVLRADVDGRVADVAIDRAGWAQPMVAAPAIGFTTRDVTWKAGALDIGRLEVTAAPATIVDARVDPAQRFDFTALHATGEGLSLPGGRRGDVAVTARLADGARVEARGKARLVPLAADLVVSLAAIDLARVRPYLPRDTAVTVTSGRADAKLAVTLDGPRAARASGEFAVRDFALLRAGQSETFVRDPRLTAVVSDLRIDASSIGAAKIAITGTPVVVDTTPASPQRYELASFSVTAEKLSWPPRLPLRVDASGVLAGGGRSTLSGTLDPRTLAARARATFTDIDVGRLRPYLPADAPVTATGARLSATVDLSHDRARGVVLDGDAVLADVALVRKGQAVPLVTDPRLTAHVTRLTVKDGRTTLEKLTVSGAPTVVDATSSPPLRLRLSSVALAAEDVTWPAERSFHVSGTAALDDGGSSTLDGTLDLRTLASHARATFTDVDVTRARGYLPTATPVVPARGRATATVDMSYERDRGVVLDATATITDFAIARPDGGEPLARDPGLTVSLTGLAIKGSSVSLGNLQLTGTPSITDTRVSPARRFEFGGLTATMAGELWPGQAPARLAVTARLPERGALSANGTATIGSRSAKVAVKLLDATVAPYGSFLPIQTDVRGALDAVLGIDATWGDHTVVSARGRLTARDIALGPPDRPLLSIASATATGVDVRWPESIRVDRLAVEQPHAFLERNKDGTLPLRALLTHGARAGQAAASKDSAAESAQQRESRATVFAVRELAITGGELRFIDRSTTPFYSEEATDLAVEVDGLTSVPGERATVHAKGVVGATAALDVSGRIAPLATPFSLDLQGLLTDFAVPRTNPYLRHILDWIAVRGWLTTKLRYRILGDALEAHNDLVVEQLDLEPAGPEPDKLVGLPLGLVVSLLKDTRGDIRLSVPITGTLSAPHFTFSEAVATALRNVIIRVVTAPFRAIGAVFTRGEKIAEVKIDPLVFETGGASLTPGSDLHLQRVADFLRAAPFVRLELDASVTADDLAALRAHEVALRLERLQRERGVKSFPDAVRRLYTGRFPGREMPPDIARAVTELQEREPLSDETVAALASRRLATTRQALIDAAGIEPERLIAREGPPTPPASGPPRVDFRLLPAAR